MTIQISKALEEAMHGDKAVLNYLEGCRKSFLAGNKTALFEVVILCAQYQAIIPEWAVDEILKIFPSIEAGELRSLDDAFGYEDKNQATLKKNARLKKHTNDVLALLQKYRLEGASLTADDILQTVADELGMSRRDVNDIYNASGNFIKTLPRGNPDNSIFAFANITMPSYRRHGRSILTD